MNTKLTVQFLMLTFGIVLITWGLMIILGQFGIMASNHLWLFIPWAIGGVSPAIASYFSLKKNNQVSDFKEWLKSIFNVKISPVYYLFAIIIVSLFHVIMILASGLTEIRPLYMFFPLLVGCFFSGGLEEAGWRYILQPELDKKQGFAISAIITGVIWFLWHLPLFFIPDANQSNFSFLMYLILNITMSFSFGAVRKISGSVFLAIFAHTLHNAVGVGGIFIYNFSWVGTIVASAIIIFISIIVVSVFTKKAK